MSAVTLGNMLSYPLHVASWKRPSGSVDYRVTNSFDGPDYLNGGKHQATDVGNFRGGDSVRAPAACRGMGLRHTDGALGVRFDLGHGVAVELWHLSKTLLIGKWQPLAQGQVCGATGNSGARMPDGSAMPFHTHIEGERNGVRFDIERYLPMVERAAIPLQLEEDDVRIPTGTPLAQGVVGPGNRLRTDPATAEGSRVIGSDIGEAKAYFVQVYQLGIPGESYVLGGKAGSSYAWVGVFGSTWFVAEPLVTDVKPTSALSVPPADCSAQETTIAQLRSKIARAGTANAGAMQAQQAVKSALS